MPPRGLKRRDVGTVLSAKIRASAEPAVWGQPIPVSRFVTGRKRSGSLPWPARARPPGVDFELSGMALAAPIPTGTVTLLFTDIEGSTRRWEERRDAMAQALRRHDELVRRAIERHGGHVFKTVGDAFCAAFWRATDALAAAIDAQRELSGEDWNAIDGLQVRMALHSGTTDEREGDYFGPAVNRVARLLATAHGGQVIFSDATASLLRGVMPERSESCDLGEHRLADLVEPEHVWQLVAPGLAQTFPPLRSLASMPNNLPRQLTPLVGRDEVLAEIQPAIREHALVTLVGTGGVGKTRVALQVGADSLDGCRDGVWFVELALTDDGSLVASAIASTLGLREQPERPVLETLLRYLKDKHLLLILDNCEHVIEEVAKIADTILRGSPDVRLLATSREPLRIAGEYVYRMPSLAFPSQRDTLTAEDALRYGAVALFTQRAAASDARFKLTDENAPVVAEICRRLDGIALAIELAAARVKVLAPRQLAEKLDKRFRVLTGGSRTALPRQQTMRALIDWSHDLLSTKEQKLFRRLAIFVGGWTLETAGVACADEEAAEDAIESWEVLDLLSSLVEKSLVHVEQIEGGMRYRYLESTREYARERLAEAGEEAAIAQAHAAAFLELGEELYEFFETTPEREWLVRAEPELENFRAALTWALRAQGDVLLGQRLSAALRPAWTRFAAAEGQRWIQAARDLSRSEMPASVEAALECAEAAIATALNQPQTARERAEPLWRSTASLANHCALRRRDISSAGRSWTSARSKKARNANLGLEGGQSNWSAQHYRRCLTKPCGRTQPRRRPAWSAAALCGGVGDVPLRRRRARVFAHCGKSSRSGVSRGQRRRGATAGKRGARNLSYFQSQARRSHFAVQHRGIFDCAGTLRRCFRFRPRRARSRTRHAMGGWRLMGSAASRSDRRTAPGRRCGCARRLARRCAAFRLRRCAFGCNRSVAPAHRTAGARQDAPCTARRARRKPACQTDG